MWAFLTVLLVTLLCFNIFKHYGSSPWHYVFSEPPSQKPWWHSIKIPFCAQANIWLPTKKWLNMLNFILSFIHWQRSKLADWSKKISFNDQASGMCPPTPKRLTKFHIYAKQDQSNNASRKELKMFLFETFFWFWINKIAADTP